MFGAAAPTGPPDRSMAGSRASVIVDSFGPFPECPSMSQDVRVHVRLGSLRLDYAGSQDFYESKVEALVAAAARGGGTPNGRDSAPVAAPSAPPSPSAPEPVAPPPAPAGFTPKSPEFGRFIRRLGPEAAEPDRQVVALAFYLWNYERREVFTEDEIRGCFKALGLPAPDDLAGIFSDLADRKRFLEPAGEGAWKLAKKGENYVKTRLLSA
jgi:hypothetical protein